MSQCRGLSVGQWSPIYSVVISIVVGSSALHLQITEYYLEMIQSFFGKIEDYVFIRRRV